MTTSIEDRPALPALGHEISRPSSTSTQSSVYVPQRHSSTPTLQLPGLSTLASIASSSAPAGNNRFFNVGHSMNYATAAPATATPGGGSTAAPPVCQNCTTSTTPLWRRDELGSVLCNACGLFLKLHGRPRPISLKTDVIKSRNRVKTAGQGAKRKAPSDANGLPAAHPDAGTPPPSLLNQRRASQKLSSGISDRSNSPVSRTGTPGLSGHPSNIAPQQMFDSVIDGHTFHSPSLPAFNLRQPSPGATSSVNGSHLEPPMSYEALTATNTSLKTRVSELEVINDLFRGRVSELEQSEQDARRAEALAKEGETRVVKELGDANAREAELNRRLVELQAELSEYREGAHRQKRMKLSDIVDESRASTPLSNPSQ